MGNEFYGEWPVYSRDLSDETVSLLDAANTALAEARERAEREYAASPMWEAINRVTKAGSTPTFRWDGTRLSVKYTSQPDHVSRKSPHNPLYIGEKTINTLLNGKLLSDTEKRKLIERITNGEIPADSTPRLEASEPGS